MFLALILVLLVPYSTHSPHFSHASRSQNAKLWVFLALVLALLVYFFLGLACGFTLSKCL